jgi:TRAP-type C4-dicarboxylate transport system permease small subunit
MVYGSILGIAVLMVLVVADVLSNYIFSRPITGTPEMAEYLMICLLIGMAPAAIAGQHVRVDAVIMRLKSRVQAVIESVLYVLCLGMAVMLTWRGLEQGLLVLSYHSTSSMLRIPRFPFYLILVISFGMLAVAIVFLLVQRITEAVKR